MVAYIFWFLSPVFLVIQSLVHGSCRRHLQYFILNTVAQSICTQYSRLSGQPAIFLGSGTLKKGCYELQKVGCKGCLFSFWVTMTLFLYPIFATHLLDLFFRSQTHPCFQNKKSGCRLTGRLCFINGDTLSVNNWSVLFWMLPRIKNEVFFFNMCTYLGIRSFVIDLTWEVTPLRNELLCQLFRALR